MQKVSTVIQSRYAYYLGLQMKSFLPAKRQVTERDFNF